MSLWTVSGCQIRPTVSYEHLSRPNVSDDGYDLFCAGAITDKGGLAATAELCENAHEWGDNGTYFKGTVRYVF